MKKFIIIVAAIVGLAILWDTLYYRMGWYIDFNPKAQVTTFVKTEEKQICMNTDGIFEPFEIKGVDMGSGIPGEWSTDFAIEKDTYKRWFAQIQEMGANTVRIYAIQDENFYNAFYEYNKDNSNPLWLLHGVWVNDYIHFSRMDAFAPDFIDTFIADCKTMVDVIHGERKISLGRLASAGSGSYTHDISEWVIGYILGVEWESETVIYTNQVSADKAGYTGDYMYTTEDASSFESMLARVGDKVLEYESKRYKEQRLIAFSNWPTTDPFKYSVETVLYSNKIAVVDVEHIKTTDKVLSGQFASYHIYPYYPDYLNTTYRAEEINSELDDVEYKNLVYRLSQMQAPPVEDYLEDTDYYDEQGRLNTYRAYLSAINRYHEIPVVISEFGISTGRGIAHRDENTGRNQGNMSEQQQGQALIECYQDIKAAGCAGSCVFSWQDEWFKRTWNTLHAVDLTRNPY